MQIVIVGVGKVGKTLVKQLSLEDNNITVVDTNPDRVREVSTLYDVMGVVGNGSSYRVLAEAGIDKADMMIAVTHSDEVNLLSCVIAKQANECSTIARVRNPVYSDERLFLQKKLGISMLINPEFEAAKEVAHLLQFPSAIEIYRFGKGTADMMRMRVPEDSFFSEGRSLKELSKWTGGNVLICMVERDGRVLIPSGDTVIEPRDIISIIAKPKDAAKFFHHIGVKSTQIRNILIIGGGKVTYYLAKLLDILGIDTKIIEKRRERCEELADLLPFSTIVCGDGSDHELLKEEHFELMDAMLASTSIDEENIILSLYARDKIKQKVITHLSHLDVSNVIEGLNLDSIVSPKNLTAEMILRYVRARANSMGSNVETLYKLRNGEAEALEFLIQPHSKISGIPLQDLNLKVHVLIAGIVRNGQFLVPGGADQIMGGDSVIVITTNIGYTDIQDVLA